MPIKLALLLISLALTQIAPAYGETNAAGDEILIMGDMPGDIAQESRLIFSPSLQSSSSLNYLPEIKTANPAPSNSPALNSSAALSNSPSLSSPEVAVSEDLRDRIINGYAMPEVQSEFTSNHESWYASRPDYVKRMVARSQKYLYHIVGEVEKRGMPTEIALLPMVESAFNPQAYSTSRASGMWQFIPSTGKDFGLKQNWWVDNRRDVTAATNAALNYLQKLHVMFGTWELALAAYNAGEGTVKRAIERNERQGLPTDYESLPLPVETRNYVPKLQAIKNIMTNPERYGLDIQPIANRPYFTKVSAPEQIDIKLAAKLAEISDDEFAALNPGYNRPVLTSSGSVHEILLPVNAAQTFTTNLANYNKPLVSWQTYHAKRGERMDKIAQKFGIDITQLRNVNDLPSRSKLGFSRPLLVPNGKSNGNEQQPGMQLASFTDTNIPSENKASPNEQTSQSKQVHTVKKNETLASIAKQYSLSPKKLMTMNQLSSPRLKPGQALTINMAVERPNSRANSSIRNVGYTKASISNSKKKFHYIVKRGDTLESIARKFDVARDELQRWNNMNNSRITPGNKLIVQRSSEA